MTACEDVVLGVTVTSACAICSFCRRPSTELFAGSSEVVIGFLDAIEVVAKPLAGFEVGFFFLPAIVSKMKLSGGPKKFNMTNVGSHVGWRDGYHRQQVG